MSKFEFKYSAPAENERKEIEEIMSSYKQKSEKDIKLEKLRALDNKVKDTPVIISLILGICGVLIFGTGLTMILEWNLLVWGIVVCVVGCAPMLAAYLAYNKIYNSLKNKYSSEILAISNELLNEDKKEKSSDNKEE